jgi:hypothetical protein
LPSHFQRKAPNINIEATEIKTQKSRTCYTTGTEIALKPYFSPTKTRLIKLQPAHNIKVKTFNQIILKFLKKNSAIELFRIGIIKKTCMPSIGKRLPEMNGNV